MICSSRVMCLTHSLTITSPLCLPLHIWSLWFLASIQFLSTSKHVSNSNIFNFIFPPFLFGLLGQRRAVVSASNHLCDCHEWGHVHLELPRHYFITSTLGGNCFHWPCDQKRNERDSHMNQPTATECDRGTETPKQHQRSTWWTLSTL